MGFFFLNFHEAISFRTDPLEWTNFFFLHFHEVFRVGTLVKRSDSELSFFGDLFRDELFFCIRKQLDFFQDDSFMKRSDLWDDSFKERCDFDSLFDFQPVPIWQTFGRTSWRLLISQLPEKCGFFGWEVIFVLRTVRRRFSLKLDGDECSEVRTLSGVNEQ